MKTTKILILLLIILSAALVSSCAGGGSTAPKNPADTSARTSAPADISPERTPEASPSPPPQESAPAPPSDKFEFEEKTYTDGGILIKYPQVTDIDSAAREALNKMISDTALRDVPELPNGTEYELNYKITFNTPAVISMYFEGYANIPQTAHPYQFLRALTIDTAEMKPVRLQSLLSAVDGVVDVIINGRYSASGYEMTEEYEAAIKENLISMGGDYWLDEIKRADAPDSATASFLTEDALVISVSVPHVMGDHVEIYLPFEDLAGYRTDNSIWREIMK